MRSLAYNMFCQITNRKINIFLPCASKRQTVASNLLPHQEGE